MPKPGYATITVTDEVYEALKQYAEDTRRSIPQAIAHLLDTLKEQEASS